MSTEQKTHALAIDAYVEVRLDNRPWFQLKVPDPAHSQSVEGTWDVKHAHKPFVDSVPMAIEVGRAWWASYIRNGVQDRYTVRVIDSNGVVAEQWPKSSMASP